MSKRSYSAVASSSYGLGGPLKRSRAMSVPNPARRATLSLNAKVNRLLRAQEVKFIDNNLTATVAIGANTIINVGAVLSGTGSSDRDGLVIFWKSIAANYILTPAVTSYRVMYVLDTQPNGAVAAVADILTAPTSPESLINLSNRKRFVVLHDNYSGYAKGNYTIENAGTISKHPCRFYKKLNDVECTFPSTGGGIPTYGSLLFIVVAGSTAVTYTMYTRARFTDA